MKAPLKEIHLPVGNYISKTKITPIERIFKKVVGRKMSEAERKCFGLTVSSKIR